MASVTYYTAPGQPAWSTATPVALPSWEKPFPELNERLIFRQRFMVGASYYTPLTPNVTYDFPGVFTASVPTSPSYYLVSEENHSDERGGLVAFDRVYAAVPTTRYDYTSYAYHYPAVLTGFTQAAYSTITYAQEAGADRMFVATSVTANPGDMVALSYTVSSGSSTTRYAGIQVYVRDYANSGLITDINSAFISSTYSKEVARVNRASAGRAAPVDLVGRAVIQYDYILVTPNVTPVFTFNTRQKFTVDAQEVDYVSQFTSPTSASYAAMVTSGSYFRVEDDTWARWMGNIYEKRSAQVVAL